MVTRERPDQPGTANRPVRRSEDTRLTSGVDAHKRVQAAVARDQAEREIDQWRGPNRLDGWEGLRDGSQALDAERPWGIEGAEPYGRGLAQLLVAGEETVVLEVLVAERASALTAATRVRNQLHQVLQQLDPEYHQRWPDLTTHGQSAALTHEQAWGPGRITQTRAVVIRRLAAQLRLAETPAVDIKIEIERIAEDTLQPLIALKGGGVDG